MGRVERLRSPLRRSFSRQQYSRKGGFSQLAFCAKTALSCEGVAIPDECLKPLSKCFTLARERGQNRPRFGRVASKTRTAPFFGRSSCFWRISMLADWFITIANPERGKRIDGICCSLLFPRILASPHPRIPASSHQLPPLCFRPRHCKSGETRTARTAPDSSAAAASARAQSRYAPRPPSAPPCAAPSV